MIGQINWNIQSASAQAFSNGGGNPTVEVRTERPTLTTKPIFSVETCAVIELSLVKEVEAVFVDRESDGEFRIISVVNDRNAALRERVYAREEAIMDTYPGLKFDFHVLARMNRKLEDVITKAGGKIFER
jgi:hypothetical protein